MADILANSGRRVDLQAAADLCGPGDNVLIPEGTWNFMEPGELLVPVIVPAGISIFGAPTQRTSGFAEPKYGRSPNGQVISWRTTLILPTFNNAPTPPGAPSGVPNWIEVIGNSTPSDLSRISDIEFVGYKNIDPNSSQMTRAIHIEGVLPFRIDHCHLLNLGGALQAEGYKRSGVIDHCVIENPVGGSIVWNSRTIHYGLQQGRGYLTTDWESDISKVLGKYLDYTIFIEDNYLSKFRHCVTANNGAHYVFRHNTVEGDYGFGSIDTHIGNSPTQVGTRAVEAYNK